MPFGQFVIGPPGSGKTTYCHGMAQLLAASGRKAALINLDPANDLLPYKPDVDISDLVDLQSVMKELGLGPNGGLVYCMDYLEKNMDWLQQALAPLEQSGAYFLFDLPGQAELFMMHDNLKAIISTITKEWHYRLTAVHLVDAHLCTEASKFISCLLLSLGTMLHLELPHVNVLSKLDLVRQYGRLDFNLDFYLEAQNLKHLVRTMSDSPFNRKFKKLSAGLCEVVEDMGLVSFVPLAVQDKEAMQHVLGLADKANGAVYASLAGRCPYPPEFIYGAAFQGSSTDMWARVEEKYLGGGRITERDAAGPAPIEAPASASGRGAQQAAQGGRQQVQGQAEAEAEAEGGAATRGPGAQAADGAGVAEGAGQQAGVEPG